MKTGTHVVCARDVHICLECSTLDYFLPVKAQLWFHVDATQGAHKRFDAVVNLFRFCVWFEIADQSQPSLLRCLEARLKNLGAARQALAADAERVRKDIMDPLTPLVLRQRGTIRPLWWGVNAPA